MRAEERGLVLWQRHIRARLLFGLSPGFAWLNVVIPLTGLYPGDKFPGEQDTHHSSRLNSSTGNVVAGWQLDESLSEGLHYEMRKDSQAFKFCHAPCTLQHSPSVRCRPRGSYMLTRQRLRVPRGREFSKVIRVLSTWGRGGRRP